MFRITLALVVLAFVAGLVALVLLTLGGEPALPVLPENGTARDRTPTGPQGPSAGRPERTPEEAAPDHAVPPATGSGEAIDPSGVAAPAGRARPVLLVGWVGTRPPEADPRLREAELPGPPVPPLPKGPPLVREIRVTGARPVRMQVRAGPPWGEREFQPQEGETTRFRLEDPHGGRGPRILRFALDEGGAAWVERYLADGEGEASFHIGEPGEFTGRITDARGEPVPGVVEADGVKAQADFNGEFTLRGVRAGIAIVRAYGPLVGYTVTRCLLRCPGGPYSIALDPGFDLDLRLEGLEPMEEFEKPYWACLVPAAGSTAPAAFAAETAYHRETRTGEFTFQQLPRSFGGVAIVYHPRHAAHFLPVSGPPGREMRIPVSPRAIVSGVVRDAETMQPVQPEVAVNTSADETTLYELAVARHGVVPPRGSWQQPVPYLGQKLVEVDRQPASGKTFEVRADPGLEQLAIRVEAAGYLPAVKTGIALVGVQNVEFKLRRDRAIPRATVVLELPRAPREGWEELVVEGTGKRSARVFPDLGVVQIDGLLPGLYWFKLQGIEGARPIQVEVDAGANLRLKFE
jgi:hypothetical protein